ncbi:MAG: SurA N-terminal domain-containing protein [Pyrinomonadaceae bacterium]
MDMIKGAEATVQIQSRGYFALVGIVLIAAFVSACGGPTATSNSSSGGSVDPNETAAKVNGKTITMEQVDRVVKQQAQGQDDKLSPLELAGARLQVLQSLVEQEVMFQKAEKEGVVITDEDVTLELNKRKTESGKSADQIDKEMRDSGVTEAVLRDSLRREIAIRRLTERTTGKIEPPKDSEIEAFYNGNKEAFVKKRGVKLAAIVVDPTNGGEGDTTVDEQSAVLKGNEIIKRLQTGADFASVARESSEDQTKFQGGDMGYVSEEEMKQGFPANVAAALMSPEFGIGKITTAQMQGKFYILKLQDRSDKDEPVTLESPGIRQQVTDQLINSRKQMLVASYQAIAMNEAKIENFLAQKVVANPNELSGARRAGSSPSNTNGNTAAASANLGNTATGTNSANSANRPAVNTNTGNTSTNANRPR